MLKIVNRTCHRRSNASVTSKTKSTTSSPHIEAFDTIEDVEDNNQAIRSGLKPEHLEVFDCAFKAYRGKRSIPTWPI